MTADPMIQKLEAFYEKWHAIYPTAILLQELRALIASAREEANPCACCENPARPGRQTCEEHKEREQDALDSMRQAKAAPPASAGTPHICPVKHGAEREMELQWVCETCGHRESVDEPPAGTEGSGLRGVAELARLEGLEPWGIYSVRCRRCGESWHQSEEPKHKPDCLTAKLDAALGEGEKK